MRLRYFERAAWSIVEETDALGSSPLLDLLEKVAAQRKGDVSGMVDLFRQAATHGPRKLTREQVHEVGEDIWEFRKGVLRVLFFEAEGRLVVCSHAFRKKTQKTPEKERNKAIRLRGRYKNACRSGTLEFMNNEDENDVIRSL